MEKTSAFKPLDTDFFASEQNLWTFNALSSLEYNWNRGPPGTYKSTSLRDALQEICLQKNYSHLFKYLIIVPTIHNSNEWVSKLMQDYPNISFLQIGGKTTYKCYGDPVSVKHGITLSEYKKKYNTYKTVTFSDFKQLIPKSEYKKYSGFYQKYKYKKLCQKDDDHEYDDGCKDCEFMNSCDWIEQFDIEHEYDVVISTPFQSNRIDHRFVAVDDSFEMYPLIDVWFKRSDLEKLNVKFRIEIKTPFRNDHKKKQDHDYFRYYDAKRKHLDFSKVPLDDPNYKANSPYMYLKWFLQATAKYPARRFACINAANRVHLFGYRECLPPHPEGMLFSCGTTSHQVLEFITHTNINQWNIFTSGYQVDQITNPLVQLPTRWNKGRQDQFVRDNDFHLALQQLNLEKIPILMVGKQKFIDPLVEQYSNIDFVHYNASRGFNDFCKPYKFIIVYGSYRFDPYTRAKIRLIGFTDAMIDDLEISEMYQAVYRARLLTMNQHTPIILFTDRLFPEIPKLKIPTRLFLRVLQHLNIDQEDMSDTQLRTLLSIKSHTTMQPVRHVLQLLQDRLISESDDEFLEWTSDTEWDG